MAPPLAGRPPFATDEPDSVYEQQPQARPRPPKTTQAPRDARSSAYDVYDNYLSPGDDKGTGNRTSGIEGLGMGFMNAMDDDDQSDDDEEDMRRTRMASSPKKPLSKNAALAAATGASPKAGFATPARFETPPPQYNKPAAPSGPSMPVPNPHGNAMPMPMPMASGPARSPPPIAAPRPGYAAPIAALNNMNGGNVARPAPTAAPGGAPALPLAPHRLPVRPTRSAPPSPQSPPVFARPQRTATMDSSSVSFSETKGLIMRGEGEEAPLARPRPGQKGDQFWRRFSMVAKDPQEKGPSAWLKKNQSGTSNLRRWVWVVGMILVICAAAGIGIGVYVAEKSASNERPETIGGAADESAIPTPTTAVATGKGAGTAAAGALGKSSELHVSATNTVARREPVPTGHARRNQRQARLEPEEAL
ncbi:hypothetical protein HMN09_00974200 [Mycena chlorophos]|uniref:Uncharacterized protein n=1 Tax=Mycena chlorophos TaxID=658473 RepID=A0A8H6VZQ2_MYCCL|nr:hypothetical protein HMN09_00974200 [Mycena chlorophos]